MRSESSWRLSCRGGQGQVNPQIIVGEAKEFEFGPEGNTEPLKNVKQGKE